MSSFVTKIRGHEKGMEGRGGARERAGEDIAGLCDERRQGTTYLDKWRASFNRDVDTKLAQ